MSIAWTYTTLKTALKNHCEDQGTEFANNLDTIIQLGEEDALKALDLEIFKDTGTISVVAGTREVTKPSGYLKADSIYLNSATVSFLKERTYEYCLDYAPTPATQGTPKFYAELNTTQLYVVPTPNAAAASAGLKSRFLKRPTSIVSAETSWLGSNAGDLLFACCMTAAERFIIGWEEANQWKAERERLLADALVQFAHLRTREYGRLAATPIARGEG